MSDMKIPPGRITPWHQNNWDWRAAGNFIGGGSGTGLLFFATLAAANIDAYRAMASSRWPSSAAACSASGWRSAGPGAPSTCFSTRIRHG